MTVEVFETTQTVLNRLIRSPEITMGGAELHNRMSKAANPVETVIFAGLDGNRAKVESLLELIYPSEYDPPEVIENTGELTPASPAAFETRNTGLTLEIDPDIVFDGPIGINYDGEAVTLNRWAETFEGAAKSVFPEFHSQRITTSITVDPGIPSILGTTRPPGEGDRILLWYLRAEPADLGSK